MHDARSRATLTHMSEMIRHQEQSQNVPTWDVSDRMRKSLRHAGTTVNEIAEYFDVSRNTVSAWINGRGTPSVQTMRLWAIRCGVPYEWLTEGVEPTDLPPDRGRAGSTCIPLFAGHQTRAPRQSRDLAELLPAA